MIKKSLTATLALVASATFSTAEERSNPLKDGLTKTACGAMEVIFYGDQIKIKDGLIVKEHGPYPETEELAKKFNVAPNSFRCEEEALSDGTRQNSIPANTPTS